MASFAILSRNVLLLGCIALFGQATGPGPARAKAGKAAEPGALRQIVRGYPVPRHVPNPKRLPLIRSQSRP